MNSNKMFLSLIPWAAFSVIINRRGADAAAIAALALAAIMLASSITVPFTAQYARESVPREYWGSPVFRSVNRRISALWGGAAVIMGAGHLLAGRLDPASNPVTGARPVDLILNWALPIALILFAVNRSKQINDAAGGDSSVQPTVGVGSVR